MAALPLDIETVGALKFLTLQGMFHIHSLSDCLPSHGVLKGTGIESISTSLCQMEHLEILSIAWELSIESIPKCIASMTQLKAVWIEGCRLLSQIPLTLFSMPLMELSLFGNSIGYLDLVEYNKPEHLDLIDTESVHLWFNETFSFDTETTNYWASENPICQSDSNSDEYPKALQQFVEMEGHCDEVCIWEEAASQLHTFCSPRNLGDGNCDDVWYFFSFSLPLSFRLHEMLMIYHSFSSGWECRYDMGDCSQLCFAAELTNCTLNETLCVDVDCEEGVCEVDDSCSGKYCKVYAANDYEGSGTPFAFTDSICEARGPASESRYGIVSEHFDVLSRSDVASSCSK